MAYKDPEKRRLYINEWRRTDRKRNPERYKINEKRSYQKHKEKKINKARKYRIDNKEIISKKSCLKYNAIKSLVLLYYSDDLYPRCNCCKIFQKEFLCIDHINGGGTRHNYGHKIYSWLFWNGFPEGYQVLCHSCNRSKRDKQYCIHSKLIELKPNLLSPKQIRKKRWDQENKIKVMKYYSKNSIPFCKCCGETELEFLEIDHINGGGRKHYNQITGTMARWLIKNKFPNGYQILCSNCNFVKGNNNKSCPHKTQKFISIYS